MGKRPGVQFEFGRLPKRRNAPTVKFDFETLNPQIPQRAPNWAKGSGVKFEIGSLSKRIKSHGTKFEFGPIQVVFVGPQKLAKAPKRNLILRVDNSVL
jgi:hypothetical protein